MPVRIETSQEAPAGWDTFAHAHPAAVFSHQAAWLQVVREVYGGKPYYLTAYEGEEIVGILPLMARWAIGRGRALVSVPFADVGGVCTSSETATATLLEAAAALGADLKVNHVELRQLDRPVGAGLPCDTTRVMMVRELPDSADSLWDDLKAKVRNQVRKAERSELVAVAGGNELLEDFYRVYARNTRDLGSPMHAAGFFGKLARAVGDDLAVILVQQPERTIAGGVALRHEVTMSVPWAGSLREHRALCPNNLLYWAALTLAVESGCSRFDFGRSIPDSGTYRFKKQWGSEEHQLHYQFLPLRGPVEVGERREGRAYRLFSGVWPHIPMWLAERIGPRFLGRLPI